TCRCPGLRTFAAFLSAHPSVMAANATTLWIDREGRFLRTKREAGFKRFVLLHDHHCVPQPSMAYLLWTGVGFLLGLSLRAQALAAPHCPEAG
ncbi:hypothetical protein, partial [Pelomicrobium sp. G1]|uniref:hypothetical protein n=1 Tax=Pelomicrobium sp. G1 TaxID=3452920 RepID=UPI003F75A11D